MDAFKDLLTDSGDLRDDLDGLNFSRLDEVEVASLEVPFSVAEVHKAISELNGDKALDLDGFTSFCQFS